MDSVENIINAVYRMSPLVLIGWGLLLVALKKYQKTHQSEIAGRVLTYI